jgi:acetoin:2,6-dichlorophenolindophenol oxidoreductase subunit alpha
VTQNSEKIVPRLDSKTRRQMLDKMLEIRVVEARIQELFLENVIRGTTHLCDGQEAVSVGMAAALDAARGDTVTCTYRGHGHALALGLDLKPFMAELMGKESGCCKGKGGSMHLTDMNVGLIGTFAIVGAGLPITNGAALTAQIKKTGAVSVSIFGDGAVNIGAWHEAVNLAAVWKLPSIFLCENNLYGEYSAFDHTSPVPNVVDRAAAYNIPGIMVDGQDVEAVYEVVRQAVERARAGDGPTLIEAKTYRYRGHSRTDPAAYRPSGELDQWLERDPITILSQRMIASGELSETDLAQTRKIIEDRIHKITQWALDEPYPPTTAAFEDIWV